ncbi:MAG: hypothetical protein FJX67_01815 [Alphaproteobacteria bacterium]|nr:hypothetical protein [Alphaproteobacteria bacterium]
MSYTIQDFATDCRKALAAQPGPAGRETVRRCVERALKDKDFVAAHLGPQAEAERHVLYEDPELGFCILAHVYKGARNSLPHDHGPSWAIYGQATGVTEMTDWELVARPSGDAPGKVRRKRVYNLEPGIAHLYNEGDLHSPRRERETRLIRIEGKNMMKVRRDKYEAVD